MNKVWIILYYMTWSMYKTTNITYKWINTIIFSNHVVIFDYAFILNLKLEPWFELGFETWKLRKNGK